MKPNGLHFYRIGTTLVMVLLALAVAAPMTAAANPTLAALPKSDDFNTCGLNNSIWPLADQKGGTMVGIDGAFTSNSTLRLTIPAGQNQTFSNKNTDAPRIMQPISDDSFEVEAKFDTPLGKVPQGTWNIQGFLVQDTTSGTWLRFDVNSSTKVDPITNQPVSSINYYIGHYVQSTNSLDDIVSVKSINTTDYETGPLYLRLKYDKVLNQWTFKAGLGNNTSWAVNKNFAESLPSNLHPSPITFIASKIGVFAGSTNTEGTELPPGITSQVDYFRLIPDAQFVDDNMTVKVTTAGAGKGTVNFPITDGASQCAGNVLSLTASPGTGSIFDGWTGDQPSKTNPINLTMNKSYNLIANFIINPNPVETNHKLFMPILVK